MRRILYRLTLGAIAALLLAYPSFAQNTIPVTGHLADSSQGVPAGMSVKFELYNCGANYPRVFGSFGIVRQNFTLTPDLNGLITGTITPNDLINCGGVTGTTRYYVTPLLNGIPQVPAACYAVLSTMGTFNLDTATPCTSATPPPPPGGPYDATYDNLTLMGLLSGNNAVFSGTVQAHKFLLDFTPNPCSSGYVTGLNADFTVNCGTPASAPVTSVFGRAGNVSANTGDYNCGMVTGSICSLPTFYYQTVAANGSSQTQRGRLNLNSGTNSTVSCVDNAGANSTDCTISSSGAGGTARTCNSIGCYRIDADGTIEQWVTDTNSFTTRGTSSITWPIPFPTSCSNVQTTAQFDSPITTTNAQGAAFYPQPGDCRTSVTLYHDIRSDGSVDGPFHAVVYAVGW
ncbi:MAG TPA: hypothetical protein VGU67_03015 [Edaphobacter sp.]|nr:hypothetical protein [Edaphobacter sp.]